MKSQPDAHCRKRIEDLRIPAVKGIPDNIYHMLHHSLVDIRKTRRSIKIKDGVLDLSMEATEILQRLGSFF
jgi:hypothetical protein